jgi:MerR family transcriptional regulator, light-induced transcriptional regulator
MPRRPDTFGGRKMASLPGSSRLGSRWSDWRGARKAAETSAVEGEFPANQGVPVPDHASGSNDLSLMLENLVIPRLIAGCGISHLPDHAKMVQPGRISGQRAISASDVAQLTDLSVSEDAHTLLAFVERFLSEGNSVETIYVELLAPAARRLGEYWEVDREDFVSVTMALWRIQEVLRELSQRVPPLPRASGRQRTALFSTLPGEQHSLGTLMIADCFERAGWMTDVLIEPDRAELTGKFASQHYDLIGLNISCTCSGATLAGLMTTIRTVSRNSNVKVLIGGRTVNAQPELVGESGADGTAGDANAAIVLADQLVPADPQRPNNLI